MRRNIELKARLGDLPAARRRAQAVATDVLGVERQTDTYFRCANGRLKLREREGQDSQLIWYARPDHSDAKASDYLLIPVSQPDDLKQALALAHGIWLIVAKQREIYLVDNVRIHLDQVAGLGEFLEFEAVLGPEIDDAQGHAQLAQLTQHFGIQPDQRVDGSYSDLLAARR